MLAAFLVLILAAFFVYSTYQHQQWKHHQDVLRVQAQAQAQADQERRSAFLYQPLDQLQAVLAEAEAAGDTAGQQNVTRMRELQERAETLQAHTIPLGYTFPIPGHLPREPEVWKAFYRGFSKHCPKNVTVDHILPDYDRVRILALASSYTPRNSTHG